MSKWKQLDPDYQDHRADARCLECDRHLGLGSRGNCCANCTDETIKQADAERDQAQREEALRAKYREWKPAPAEDREAFRRVLMLCVS